MSVCNTRFGSLAAAALAASLAGCQALPPEQPRALLMGQPVFTGLGQVRDSRTGEALYVPCNPCALPTPKTPVSGGFADQAEAAPQGAISLASLRSVSSLPTAMATGAVGQMGGVLASTVAEPVMRKRPVQPVAMTKTKRVLSFAPAKSALDTQAQQIVTELLPLAQKAQWVFVRGGTDATGTVGRNRALAQARAAAVRAALLTAGVSPDKIKTSACVRCYQASNDTADGRRKNRRVEIVLVMQRAAAPTVAAATPAAYEGFKY